MKLGIEIPTDIWLDGGWMHDGVTAHMLCWLSSPEKEYLESLDIPFLFIGLGVFTPNSSIILDIDKKHYGMAKVVCRRYDEKIRPNSFIDLRIDKIRDRFNLDYIPSALEKACSYQRELHVYSVNKYCFSEES